MADYHDDHISQSEEDLRHLEDEHGGETPSSRRSPAARDLPRPLYRIRALHSNETFFAYFPAGAASPTTAASPASSAAAAPAAPPFAPLAVTSAVSAPPDATPALSSSSSSAEPPPSEETPTSAAEAGMAVETGAGLVLEPDSEPESQLAASQSVAPGTIAPHTMVVAPTRYGRDICELQGLVQDPGPIGADELVKIERIATSEDLKKAEANEERERKAFDTCRQKIAVRNLPMKLVSAHYLLEEPKVLFYFSAESRVDFRELVKDLVSVFKMRIELRQIGVRDEARVTGGCGVCGRVLCCHGVTDKLTPVSIKMAKDQNLSLNSMKISGPCGRLLCCLAYEYGFYRDARRELPNEGARFSYDGTLFRVIEVNALAGSVKVAGEDGRLLDMSSTRFAYTEGRWQVRPESQDRPSRE